MLLRRATLNSCHGFNIHTLSHFYSCSTFIESASALVWYYLCTTLRTRWFPWIARGRNVETSAPGIYCNSQFVRPSSLVPAIRLCCSQEHAGPAARRAALPLPSPCWLRTSALPPTSFCELILPAGRRFTTTCSWHTFHTVRCCFAYCIAVLASLLHSLRRSGQFKCTHGSAPFFCHSLTFMLVAAPALLHTHTHLPWRAAHSPTCPLHHSRLPVCSSRANYATKPSGRHACPRTAPPPHLQQIPTDASTCSGTALFAVSPAL